MSETTPMNPELQLLPGAPEATNRMYGIIVGYWASQIAGVLARLQIPDRLAAQARTAEQLAQELDLDRDALFRLLRAASAIDILDRDSDGAFALTQLGATLRADVPGSLRGLAATLTAPCHWLPWGRLEDAIRTGSSQASEALAGHFFEYLAQHPAELSQFADAMEELSSQISDEVAGSVDLSDARTVVDVGGGSGTLLAAVLARHPDVHGTILERPEMAAAARAMIADRGLQERCDVVEGDFFRAVPEADVYLLKLIVHDWDDDHAAAILRTCADSLRAGGRIVIIEALVPEDGSAPTECGYRSRNREGYW